MKERISLFIERTNLRTATAAFVFLVLGFIALIVTIDDKTWQYHTPWRSLIQTVGSLLVVTGLISIAWELLCKRSLTEEVLARAGLSNDITKAGLTTIQENFRNTTPLWNTLLADATDLIFFVCWAESWRKDYYSLLEGILRRGGKITVILPDPQHQYTVQTLSTHFGNYTLDQIVEKISRARNQYENLSKEYGCQKGLLEIWFIKRSPLFSWYRVDNKHAVFAFYAHRGYMSGAVPVPMIVVHKGGYLYDFATKEMEFLISGESEARKVFPNDQRSIETSSRSDE